MTTTPHTSNEPSHTAEVLAHQKHPFRDYLIVWAILMVLLIATVAASYLPTTEPWSFLIALVIAIIKAVLVVLFFMHVRDASRVTWVFCAAGFLFLTIMLVLTFGDYLTRVQVGGATSAAQSDTPGLVMPSEGAAH